MGIEAAPKVILKWEEVRDDAAAAGFTYHFEEGRVYLLISENRNLCETALRWTALLARPTQGEIELDQQRVSQLSQEALGEVRNRQLGFLFAAPFLLPGFTLLENIAMPLFKVAQVRPEQAKQVTDDVLDLVGLTAWVECPVEELSMLEQHLAALARAIILHPKILIAQNLAENLSDEDTGSLVRAIRRVPGRLKTSVIATAGRPLPAYFADVVLEFLGEKVVERVRPE